MFLIQYYGARRRPASRRTSSCARRVGGAAARLVVVELRMPRAWKLAFVVVLSTADGIRSRCRAGCTCVPLLHAALQESVAAETTRVSDIEVRSQDDTQCACFSRRFCVCVKKRYALIVLPRSLKHTQKERVALTPIVNPGARPLVTNQLTHINALHGGHQPCLTRFF